MLGFSQIHNPSRIFLIYLKKSAALMLLASFFFGDFMASKARGFETETETLPVSTDTISSEELKVQTFELQDLGRRLPLGFFADGSRLDYFELHPYTTQHDLILAQRTNEDFHIKLGRFLPQIVKSIGGIEITELAKSLSTKPEKLFQRAYLADVFAIVLNVRLETVGADIAIADQCRRCGAEYKDSEESGYHDLGQCEIGVALNLMQPPIVEVVLPDGFKDAGRTVKTIHLQPLRAYQTKETKGTPEDKIEIVMMQKMVCGLPDLEEYQGVTSNLFNDDFYRKLSLKDRDILMKVARRLIKLGPQMVVEMVCEACRFKQSSSLPWYALRQFCSESANASE